MRRCVRCQAEGRVHPEPLLARSFHRSHINYFVDTTINWRAADLRPSAAKREEQLRASFKSIRLNAANKDHQREHWEREGGEKQRRRWGCFRWSLRELYLQRLPLGQVRGAVAALVSAVLLPLVDGGVTVYWEQRTTHTYSSLQPKSQIPSLTLLVQSYVSLSGLNSEINAETFWEMRKKKKKKKVECSGIGG